MPDTHAVTPRTDEVNTTWFQPEGLSESSRWSKRSADHRTTIKICFHPERVAEMGGRKRWHPPESVGEINKCLSLRLLSDLCVSVVVVFVGKSTTETQSSPRSHRELEIIPTGSSGCAGECLIRSGGLRYAPTTGYLTAFQAENYLAPFSHGLRKPITKETVTRCNRSRSLNANSVFAPPLL